MKRLLAIAGLVIFPAAAWAGCGPPLPAADKNGALVNMESVVAISGNCAPLVGLLDAATGAPLFPTAAAAADAMANPTTTSVKAANLLWNGSTWDRWDGVNTGTGKIDLSSIGATATVAGGVNGTLAIGGNQATNNAISTNTFPVLIGGSDYGGTPKLQSLKVDSTGFGHVVAEASAAVIGHVIVDTAPTTNVNPGTAANWGINATAAAPVANAVYVGANASGATGGLVRGKITCDQHAVYDASDNGSITLVTGVSGRKVYICGYTLATGGTATNLALKGGTNANCAAGTYALTPVYQMTANDLRGALAPEWTGMVSTTAADFVCVNASAGNAHQAEIWYSIL